LNVILKDRLLQCVMSLERRAMAGIHYTEADDANFKLSKSEIESMARDLRVFIKNEAARKEK